MTKFKGLDIIVNTDTNPDLMQEGTIMSSERAMCPWCGKKKARADIEVLKTYDDNGNETGHKHISALIWGCRDCSKMVAFGKGYGLDEISGGGS